MKLNEVIQHVDLSKRAIKFYEEKNLLKVERDENGYRNYTQENLETLKAISVYRKLGIDIKDIKLLLHQKDISLLQDILKKKEQNLEMNTKEVAALRSYIETNDVNEIYEALHYETVAQAIQDAIPGFYGYYFLNHFLPYLQGTIETPQQKEAYQEILNYWDNTELQLPLVMKITGWMIYRFHTKSSIKDMSDKIDKTVNMYLYPTEEEYKKLKKQIYESAKLKQNPFYKYSIAGMAQRKFMRELQNKGYNDIFLPNMMVLSPTYKQYHDALYNLNDRICKELGLYYDSDFQLKLRK